MSIGNAREVIVVGRWRGRWRQWPRGGVGVVGIGEASRIVRVINLALIVAS
jgi:hypothetical protein